ncbi:2-oxoglutarate dehydrogenase E2 component (dihydrolipoamide succinyltransferase) [Kineococcus xinjiangensis]|uniref:Dihydrolipoamide acetyltransferase component of pyruvate dehydrogenase complex n=1 Tax=Kineococcus xinjiangensis TaxID=512762 RepID=A0A2S6IMA1_9ACTN|nr:2-oxoglutarate dehydrogenase E2 component (dihydrolipoamide succinyltransferase) [Kineococcus xinjiangensis]
MSNSVQMPALGESVTEGTVTRWLKQVGDTVEVDEPLLEVSTDKVDTEIPSPVAGVLEEILVGEDETVEVGTDLARIGDGSGGGQQDSGQDDAGQDAGQDDAGQDEAPQQDAQEQDSDQDSGQQEKHEAPQAEAKPASGGGTAVQMPALGESVTEGTVTRWLKQVGDTVEVDEPLLEVSTDKVDTEIPSPVAGVLEEILVGEDETVEVGTDLARIGDGSGGGQQDSGQDDAGQDEAPQQDAQEQDSDQGETLADEVEERAQAHEQAASATSPDAQQEHTRQTQETGSADSAPEEETEPAPQSGGAPATGGTTYVTPLVRKLAAQHNVDLNTLQGTGVGGRVRKQDVLEAAERAAKEAKAAAKRAKDAKDAEAKAKASQPAAAAPAPAAGGAPAHPAASAKRGTTEKMSRLRKVIAQRMVESLQTSAQLTTVIEVDITRIAKLRAKAKNGFEAREGVKLSFLPFFVKAAIEALKQHPVLNASVEGDSIVYHGSENVSIAVDTPKGLIVPVIKDAGDLNLAGISRKIADLADRTRSNKITPDDLAGGTFTITNTGSVGALFDTPIINQPQVAILGTGAVVKRAVVVPDADGNDSIAIRSMIYLALSYDHRIVDGADAARFLHTVKQRLEAGEFEGELGL